MNQNKPCLSELSRATIAVFRVLRCDYRQNQKAMQLFFAFRDRSAWSPPSAAGGPAGSGMQSMHRPILRSQPDTGTRRRGAAFERRANAPENNSVAETMTSSTTRIRGGCGWYEPAFMAVYASILQPTQNHSKTIRPSKISSSGCTKWRTRRGGSGSGSATGSVNARARDQASGHRVSRTGRTLAVLLSRRRLRGVLTARRYGATATVLWVAASTASVVTTCPNSLCSVAITARWTSSAPR